MRPSDTVRVEIVVALDPATAFALFTEHIDAWWVRNPMYRFRPGRDATMRFEPGVGGRFLAAYGEDDVFEIGRVRVWEPGARLVFQWRLPNFQPHESTEVEIRFEAVAEGTRVRLAHRGWGDLPGDHPARHGKADAEYAALLGRSWLDLLRSVRRHGARAAP